ncbi:MAG: TonB-dependent receptor [Gemmatimonadota bacterium]
MRRHLFAIAFLFAATQLASAQGRPVTPPPSGPGELRGTVLDAKDSMPLARASATIRSKRDSSLVAGAIATPAGTFRAPGLRPGRYSLRVAALGYTPVVRDFAITDSAPIANVGVLRLSRFAVTLGSVNVVEEAAAATIEPDRNTYRAKDVAPGASNASDVLENVPSVAVDADGKVSLRGNENVAIQINGRPSPIRGTQLAAYLKSLPANVLDRVEVVPNPSAKYDPEGMAGIINIVMKQNVDLGFSGGVNANAANKQRYGTSGNVGYQAGNLSTFTTYGFNAEDRNVIGINDRQKLGAALVPLSFTDQDISTLNGNAGHNASLNVDYKLNPRDVVSNVFSFNRRRSSDATLMAYSELNSARTLLDRYDRLRNTGATGWMVDYSLAFKRTFEPRKHEVNAEVRFNRGDDDDETMLWRQAPLSSSLSSPKLEGERDITEAVSKSFNAQLDYTRTLAARTKLETGFKSTTRWLDRDYNVLKDPLGTNVWVRSDLSNGLEFDEEVNAVYGVLSQGAGKFELQGGLRGELASRDFKLAGSASNYPYQYASVFPSGIVMYNVNDGLQLKSSYSRRIRRPGTQELNPFPTFFDVQNVFLGNPKLDPEYTDALELGLVKNGQYGTFQLSPFFRHTTNIIRVIIDTDDMIDGRNVTSISFQNLATSNSWGADVNGQFRYSPKLSVLSGFNIFKMVTDGGSLSSVGSNAIAWMGRMSVTSNLTPTLMVQGNYQYRAPMKIERGEFAAVTNVNFTVRKKVDGDNLAVLVRVLDPFSTNRFRISTGDDNVYQITERTAGVRGVFLGVQYNFGQVPRVRQVEQQQQSGPGFP